MTAFYLLHLPIGRPVRTTIMGRPVETTIIGRSVRVTITVTLHAKGSPDRATATIMLHPATITIYPIEDVSYIPVVSM